MSTTAWPSRTQRWTIRDRHLLGLLLAVAAMNPTQLVAQNPATSVSVMRRAIEAMEAWPHPQGYVILEREFPHRVLVVYSTPDSATRFVEENPGRDLVRVPLYHTVTEEIVITCEHEKYTSEIVCPEPGDSTRVFSAQELDSVVVEIYQSGQPSPQRTNYGTGIDAWFLGPAAMDKFVWPYLARYGVEYAAQRRREYMDISTQ